MTAQNPDNSRSVIKYTGQNYTFTPAYMRNRDPTTNDLRDPKNQGYYPFTALWINKTNNNLWALVKIAHNLATWILLSGGSSGPMLKIAVPNGTTPIQPDGTGLVTFTSTGGTVTITGSTAGNPNFINFDVAGGANPIEKIGVDTTSGTGTNPVVPDGTGKITVNGATVAAGTNPVRTDSTLPNQYNIEVQRSQAIAATDATKIGLSNYSNTQFAVDGNGFVTLLGGTGPALQQVTVDGAQTIVPSGSPENITLTGNTVANATHSKSLFIFKTGGSTATADIQLSTADTVGASTSAHAGVASFNTLNFTVDANAFVTANAGNSPGFSNFGITYGVAGAGIFQVTGSNGSTLTSSNPGFITIQNPNNAGQIITIQAVNNYQFKDQGSGASNINGNSFGISNANWSNDMPFFLYFVINSAGNHVTAAISRVPHLQSAPAAGKCATTASSVATTQGSLFFLDEIITGTPTAPTVANYANQACILIGYFRMQEVFAAATNQWTVQTISKTEGVGTFPNGVNWTYPVLQMGATGNIFFSSSGGDTIPTFSVFGTGYNIAPSGKVDFLWNSSSITVSGAGTGILMFTVPFTFNSSTLTVAPPGNVCWKSVAGGTFNTLMPYNDANSATLQNSYAMVKSGAATAKLTPAGITTDVTNFTITLDFYAAPV